MMRLSGLRVLITGGAGFIGSHLVDALAEHNEVVVLDDLSSGRMENISHHMDEEGFTFIRGSIFDEHALRRACEGVDIVFHLAANPEVRIGAQDPWVHIEQNVLATHTLLEQMRREGIREIAFTSTSTVYGEAEVIPTPESYGPLIPISTYGASKLACEALICAYCHSFSMRSWIFRFANIVGLRSRHGVIHDFIQKLLENPSRLEILGDGTQKKSYLYVRDCVDAILHSIESAQEEVNIFNIGSDDTTEVNRIAELVLDEMGLEDVEIVYVNELDGRGWVGDVRYMLLSCEKLRRLGWVPNHTSEESVRCAIRDRLREVGYA